MRDYPTPSTAAVHSACAQATYSLRDARRRKKTLLRNINFPFESLVLFHRFFGFIEYTIEPLRIRAPEDNNMWWQGAWSAALHERPLNMADNFAHPQKRRLQGSFGEPMHDSPGAAQKRPRPSSADCVAFVPPDIAPAPMIGSMFGSFPAAQPPQPRGNWQQPSPQPGGAAAWGHEGLSSAHQTGAPRSPDGRVWGAPMVPPSPVRYPEPPAGSAAAYFSPPPAGVGAADVNYAQANLGLKQLHLERLQRRVLACSAQYQREHPPPFGEGTFSGGGAFGGSSFY